jgi:hypothetical protein
MKSPIVILLFLFISAGAFFAQTKSIESEVQSAVNSLIELCEKDKYESIASLIIYDGKDESRYLKDTYNYSDRKEATTVKRIGKKIKAFIDLSDSHKFGRFSKTVENKVTKLDQEVIFINGEQELVKTFTFTYLNDKLLLMDFQ